MMFSSEQILNINGDSDEALEVAIECAMKLAGRNKVEAFRKDEKGLVFYAHYENGTTKYPFEPTVKVLVEQVKDYLKSLNGAEIKAMAGPCPDVDGSVELGWELFHPLWYGPNAIEEYDFWAFLAIRPSWIVYAK